MRLLAALLCACAFSAAPALAADCPPNALGTSRTIVVDPREHPRLGTMQYGETLPLADKEVVLTFDDGPLPPFTDRVLDILAGQCVKATYFIVGGMARAFPAVLRRIAAAGHTIGTHSQNHPLTFLRMPFEKAAGEINKGIGSVATILGGADALAPFFRIPGLLRTEPIEQYLAARGIETWSADFPADDWKRHITPKEIVRRALTRLQEKGKGILLLHDIHPATVLALPMLLDELKTRGYRIVHVVAASADQPKTFTEPLQWVLNARKAVWPAMAEAIAGSERVAGWRAVAGFGPQAQIAAPLVAAPVPGAEAEMDIAPELPYWPRVAMAEALDQPSALPQPDARNTGFDFAAAWERGLPRDARAKVAEVARTAMAPQAALAYGP